MNESLRSIADRALAFLLKTGRVPALVAILAITAVLAGSAARVGIESDNSSLNADDAAQARVYADFKRAFGNDEDLILALRHPHLLSTPGLVLVDALSKRIGAIEGVRRVWSLTTVEQAVSGRYGAEPRLLVAPPFDRHGIDAEIESALVRSPELAAWLVSADRQSAGFVVEIEDRPGDADYRGAIIERLRELAAAVEGGGVSLHLTGVPVQKYDVARAVDRDQRVLLPLAVVVLGSTLWVFFRSLDGVAIPLAVAGATVVWTMGLYSWRGHSLNAITSLLPPVLLVVSLAATVHIYDAWREGRHGGAARERVARALWAVALPVVFCALTTAQGFFSLTWNEIPAVRQFGAFAALGTLCALAIGMVAVPALLTFLKEPRHTAHDEHRFTMRWLGRASKLATSRPGTVATAFAAVTVAATVGAGLVRTNTDLVGFLRTGTPLRVDSEIVDHELGGALVLEFLLRARDGSSLLTWEALSRLAALEGSVRAHAAVTAVSSPNLLVREVHRAERGLETPSLPADAAALQSSIDLLEDGGHELWRRFVSADARALRLSVRLHTVGSEESLPLAHAIEDDAERVLGDSYELQPTGALYHVVHDSERLVGEQVRSFATAILLVVLTIGLVFRSVALTLVALVPNVMPILWTGGLMGVLGIELSTGTAMIASAVLGLVVDDTIHYLTNYRRAYRGDARATVHETARAVGTPVTVAAVSLVLGFWVGAFGSFRPTVYFSLLTGLTMITGVLCDVLLLPALLVLLEKWGLSPFGRA